MSQWKYIEQKEKEYKLLSKENITKQFVDEEVSSIIDYIWEQTTITNPQKAGSLKHFVSQFHIKGFSDTNKIDVINWNIPGETKSPKPKYGDMAFGQGEEEYSEKMEDFLMKIEDITSDMLRTAGLLLNNDDVLISNDNIMKNILNNVHLKIIFSIFLSIQWYRTAFTREKFRLQGTNKTFDEQILEGAKTTASYLFFRRWFWFKSANQKLWLPPHPFLVLGEKVSNLKGWEKEFSKEDALKIYTSLVTSKAQYFPINKNLLLYIVDHESEDFIWNRNAPKTISIGFNIEDFSRAIEESHSDCFLYEGTEISPNVIFTYEILVRADTSVQNENIKNTIETTFDKIIVSEEINLLSLIFSEYNQLATIGQDFVYVDKDDLENEKILYTRKEIFNVESFIRESQNKEKFKKIILFYVNERNRQELDKSNNLVL